MAKRKNIEPKAMIGTVNRFTQDDFTGGQNEEQSDTLLATSESPSAKSIRLDKLGVLRPAQGRKKVFTNNFSNNGVKGLHGYYKSDGSKTLLFAVDDKILESDLKTNVLYDTQSDFEGGTLGEFTSTTISPGYMVVDVPSGSVDIDISYDYNSQSDFEGGSLTYINTDVSPGSIVIASLGEDYSVLEDTVSELESGTLDNVSVSVQASLGLDIGLGTWSDYSSRDWSEM